MKKLCIILCLLLALAACSQVSPQTTTSSAPTESTPEITPELTPEVVTPREPVAVNVGVIRGPSGMGMACLMDSVGVGDIYTAAVVDNAIPERAPLEYSFTLASSPVEVTSMLATGELDIAALPSNTAATLYNRLNGGIKTIALTTRGVLYILENGDTVNSIEDLHGKTIYMFGQGANPEYVLNHVLRENGLEPGTDVFIEFRENEELVTLAAAGMVDICMLPVPSSTAVLMRNEDFRVALDINEEWNSLENGGDLIMTCVVIRTEFLEANPEAVESFLVEYYYSLSAIADLEPSLKELTSELKPSVEELLAVLGIVGNAAIAKNAIPYSNLCFIKGSDMQSAIEGYYDILFSADPAAIGGAIPDENFYLK